MIRLELVAIALASVPALATAGDTCATATPVTVGSYFGSTTNADNDGSALCGDSDFAPDVWYQFTAPTAGRLTVSTCSEDTTFDTVLSLHSSCPGGSFNQLDCNDDACTSGSTVNATLTQGQVVKIRVSGFDGESGDFRLLVRFGAGGIPANDTCATAITIGNGITTFDTTDAHTEGPTETFCAEMFRDVWYVYTATCTGSVRFSLCGSLFDTVAALYDSCGGAELACNDDSDDCGIQSVLIAPVTIGHTYILRVGTYDQVLEFGPGQIEVTCTESQCRADFNGDTQADFFDYLDFAYAFAYQDPAADFNGDHQIDFFDYVDFAQTFSNC
jgi:hypothetical protein